MTRGHARGAASLPVERMQRAGLAALTLVMALVALAPAALDRSHFLFSIVPLLRSEAGRAAHNTTDCDPIAVNPAVTGDRDAVLAAASLRLGCLNQAAAFLDASGASGRQDYVGFQRGLLALSQGDDLGAVSHWQQLDGIHDWLVLKAENAAGDDINEAAHWYELNILTSATPAALADAVTLYTERLRLSMAKDVFIHRVNDLEGDLAADSAALFRLRGTRDLTLSNWPEARENLTQAVAQGLDDSETWYWLAEAECQTGGMAACIPVFERALSAPLQIDWRRPWYLYRLVSILMTNSHTEEAHAFLEEAARISAYPPHTDYLATVYQQFGETEKAAALCKRARMQAGSAHPTLACEKSP